jgi:hypothetical protein
MAIELTDVITINGDPHDVAFLCEQRRAYKLRNTQSGESDNSRATFGFEFNKRTAGPRNWHNSFDEADTGTGVDPFDAIGVGLDTTKNSFDRPLNRGDGRDTKSFVNCSASLIVNASDNSIDMEELAGGAGDEDVGIVTIGNSGKGVSSLDASSTKACAIETDTNDGVPAEVFGQTSERRCLSVDHRNGVTLFNQCGGESGTDSAASNNDDVHFAPPPGVRVDTVNDPMTERRVRKDETAPVHMGVT